MRKLFTLALLLGACGSPHRGDRSASASAGAPSGSGTSSGGQGGQTSQGGQGTGGGSTTDSGAGTVGGGGAPVNDEDAPTKPVTFAPSDAVILNPERGFYATTDLVDAPNLSGLRASGATLVHSYVRLDEYRTSDLPDALLQQASAGFEKARQAGVKVILRFAYNFGPYPDSEPDAPAASVLKHIGQLQPLLAANADVVAVVQAGFIGAWGEWHTSTNNLTEPETRQQILEALVSAVPTSRSVQLRYPPYKQAMYGAPLTEANAFGGSFAARVGHHNDCFVSSDTDVGTYPDDQVDAFRDYVGADTAFVPMGGETCAVSAPRSECASALAEMTKLHFSYINREFHEDVLTSWQPCRQEMERRLGYRLLLESAALPEAVKPGGSFTLALKLKNDGFAAPFNARPVFLVLRGQGFSAKAKVEEADPRRWLAGANLQVRLRLPSTLPAGTYSLSLWLPDAAATLEARPEYALRLANEQVWDEATGENALGDFEVTGAATGGADASATDFAVLAN
ncbi:MAG TPA: DUF4832 domain-containing protein [Polyangiaceae bacterium]|nr:DUF4832 domain-containing protein [Polyangiaceae bacterium]